MILFHLLIASRRCFLLPLTWSKEVQIPSAKRKEEPSHCLSTGYYSICREKYLLSRVVSSRLNDKMCKAISQGQKEEVLASIRKGADDFDGGLIYAMRSKQKEMAFLMIEKGVKNPDWLLPMAASYGNEEIVALLISKGIRSFERSLFHAASHGHMKLVELFLDKGAQEITWPVANAAYLGKEDIVDLLLERGADINEVLIGSALGAQEKIVWKALQQGASRYEDAIQNARSRDHFKIIALIEDYMNRNKMSV